jgi:putative iron-dependent peroxidase
MHHEGDPTMILAPGLDEQQDDIQALLGSGLGWLKASRFRLLTITDPAAARRWLGELATKGLVASVAQVIDRALRPQQLCAVAFSHAGLDRLGVTPAEDFPFPTAFRSGQGSSLRQSLLRDPPRDEWQWSDCSEVAGVAAAHILLGHWWPDGAELSLPALTGVATVREVNGCPRFFNRGFLEEPFGFRDGLSQPLILGLRPDDGSAAPGPAPSTLRPEARDHVIAAGEFILGYRNEYNELSYCPDVQGWSPPPRGPAACSRFALNGSYLAVREIEQHVEAYRAFDRGRAQVAGCPAGASAGELMMGRRRDGRPLTSRPRRHQERLPLSGRGCAGLHHAARLTRAAQQPARHAGSRRRVRHPLRQAAPAAAPGPTVPTRRPIGRHVLHRLQYRPRAAVRVRAPALDP